MRCVDPETRFTSSAAETLTAPLPVRSINQLWQLTAILVASGTGCFIFMRSFRVVVARIDRSKSALSIRIEGSAPNCWRVLQKAKWMCVIAQLLLSG